MGPVIDTHKAKLLDLRPTEVLDGSYQIITGTYANGSRTTTTIVYSAVVSFVKHKWGSSYSVHPACYKLSARKSKCFVHMVHNSSTCTKYATVTLKGRKPSVSMSKPSC